MSEFKSLYEALKGWYCRPLFDYSKDLFEIVKSAWPGGLASWGRMEPSRKLAYARQWDYRHDPDTSALYKAMRDEREKFYDDHEKLKEEIARWERADAPTVLDMAKREEILPPLKARFAEMDLKLRQKFGDPDADEEVTAAQAEGKQDGTAGKNRLVAIQQERPLRLEDLLQNSVEIRAYVHRYDLEVAVGEILSGNGGISEAEKRVRINSARQLVQTIQFEVTQLGG